MAMKIVFFGSAAFAVPALRAVASAGHQIAAVYTQPARKAGRGLSSTETPVASAARALNLVLRTPARLKGQKVFDAYRALHCDAALVAAYGLLLPAAMLDLPTFGSVNIHASLLPRWRGAAPIQRALMAGDATTGISIMQMAEGLDTGDLHLTRSIAIGADEAAGGLHDRLADLGAQAALEVLQKLQRGVSRPAVQDQAGVCYAHKISKSETRIDWQRSAAELHNHIRALSPRPGAWCLMPISGKMERVRIVAATSVSAPVQVQEPPGSVIALPLEIACGQGALRLLQVQRAGGRAMTIEAFQNSAQIARHVILL